MTLRIIDEHHYHLFMNSKRVIMSIGVFCCVIYGEIPMSVLDVYAIRYVSLSVCASESVSCRFVSVNAFTHTLALLLSLSCSLSMLERRESPHTSLLSFYHITQGIKTASVWHTQSSTSASV